MSGENVKHFTEEPIPESGTQCNDALVTNLMGIPHVEQDSFSYSKSPPLELEGYPFSLSTLKDLITDLNKKIKMRPVLITFSGLPECGKTMAVQHLLKYYVSKTPLVPVTRIQDHPEAVGIIYHELVAAGFKMKRQLIVAEVAKESSCAFSILSAFKHNIVTEKELPLFDVAPSFSTQYFENRELNDHLKYTFYYLAKQISATSMEFSKDQSPSSELNGKERKIAKILTEMVPEGIARINIWDVAISKTVTHFLAALQGHLYNNHMWLFLDIERDLEHLNKPPEITEEQEDDRRDGAVLMKWRPRLHYLLRSCKMSEGKKKKRRQCTVFAKHTGTYNGDLLEKIEDLKEQVQATARHIGVAPLLEEKIETINLQEEGPGDNNDYSYRLNQKFQNVICETPFEDVPIAWVFLRSFFYCYKKPFISKNDLKYMAKECGMDPESFQSFCKFYTSFGSIFDLSLVNPEYQYVIVTPVEFLKALDNLLYPDESLHQCYPSIVWGVVPEKACREVFKGDWLAYMDALVSLNLAAKVTSGYLDVPANCEIDRQDIHYYIPISRKGPLIADPDPHSIHIITSIDTPHVFKQVSLTKRMLSFLSEPKLLCCTNMNQTIIKDVSTGATLTLTSHSPATRLHLDKPNETICNYIVEAYNDIATSCDVPVKYKFVKMCSESSIPSVQCLPSCQYHILPDDELCQKCKEAENYDDDLIKFWNEALRKHPVPQRSKPRDELKPSELTRIAEKVADYNSDTDLIAKMFGCLDHVSKIEFKSLTKDKLISEIFSFWDRNNQSKEPRRTFARMISKLGDKISSNYEDAQRDEKQKVIEAFTKMAKEIDAYYITFPLP